MIYNIYIMYNIFIPGFSPFLATSFKVGLCPPPPMLVAQHNCTTCTSLGTPLVCLPLLILRSHQKLPTQCLLRPA